MRTFATGGGSGSTNPAGSDTQVQFNDGGAFGGDTHFTYNKTTDVLHVHGLAGDATDGLLIESESGTDVGILGPANTANVTWYGNHNFNNATASRIASFGASKTLEALDTATYPSLTELSYVKGATSSIQTQLDAKVIPTWTEVTGTSQAMAINTYYIANNAALVTLTLPDTAALGSVIKVVGSGAGGWKIAQNASEAINFGNKTTTTGTGGYIASTHRYDAVELVCITANTTWNVISSIGNITYV